MQKTFRQRFIFWLDVTKSHEADIADTIGELKQKRSFAKTIRDGIRLIVDLRAGQTDVLCELFPWIAAKLQGNSVPESEATGLTEDKLRAILREMGQVSTGGAASGAAALPAVPFPQPLALEDDDQHETVKHAAPVFDDDFEMPVIEVKKSNDNEAKTVSMNFMQSMLDMQGGTGAWSGT